MVDDKLYSLYGQDDEIIYQYSPVNCYITPYSSDKQGGELITEFNQRAAINLLLHRKQSLVDYAGIVAQSVNEFAGTEVELDQTTGETGYQGPGLNSFLDTTIHTSSNWVVETYATGAKSMDDFKLSIPTATSGSAYLSVSAGRALVYGYYIEAISEILIDTSDAIESSEITQVIHNDGQNPSNPCMTKFVKLAVMYTQSPNARHDERLVPPSNGAYLGAAIVINKELPRTNELLLGTITRDSKGAFKVTNNPKKTQLIPLDSIDGAEGYDKKLEAINDNYTYGIHYGDTDAEGKVTNLRIIDPWLWLHEQSNLAKLLKAISSQVDTAGLETDANTRAIIVGERLNVSELDAPILEHNKTDSTGANNATSSPSKIFQALYYGQAYSKPGDSSASVKSVHTFLPMAYSTDDSPMGKGFTKSYETPNNDLTRGYTYYIDDSIPNVGNILSRGAGESGLMTKQQVTMLEYVFADYLERHSTSQHNNGTNGTTRGSGYGPFLTLEDAKRWFEDKQKNVPNFKIKLGDWFWVINDTAEAGGSQQDGNKGIQQIITDYGTVTGTGVANISIPNLTGSVTGTGDGTFSGETDDKPAKNVNGTMSESISGTVQGTGTGAAKVQVTGTLTSFVQNISSRYVCVSVSDTAGTVLFTHACDNTYDGKTWVYTDLDTDHSKSYSSTSWTTGTQQTAVFALEACERGFAVPATSDCFGVVKIGDGTQETDVILDNDTLRLRITDHLLDIIHNGGFVSDSRTYIDISPQTALSQFNYLYFTDGVTFKMTGKASDWEAVLDDTGTLAHIRGHVVLDYSQVEADSAYGGGYLLYLKDIDYITLHGENDTTKQVAQTATSPLKFSCDHCRVDTPFFENIGHWQYSEFITGGDTIELNCPWMKASNVFTAAAENNLYTRFASITMGVDGIVSAMLDIWIQHEGWSSNASSINRCWTSLKKLNFPPMFFEFLTTTTEESDGSTTTKTDTVVNMSTIQRLSEDYNLKIGGTAGVHEIWNKSNSEYQTSGNFLATVDWEWNGNPGVDSSPAGTLHFNLLMNNSSGDVSQKFSNVRFRVPVQVMRVDDNSFSDAVDYAALYSD